MRRRMKPLATASATPAFSTRMSPPERSALIFPSGRTFSRNLAPANRGPSPAPMKMRAPAASPISKMIERTRRRQIR
jgi:hypothetical protein